MESSTVTLHDELEAINATLSRTNLDENNNQSTDDVLRAIDEYLSEPSYRNDEFDDITQPTLDDVSTISSDTSTMSRSGDFITMEQHIDFENQRRTVRLRVAAISPPAANSDDGWEPEIVYERRTTTPEGCASITDLVKPETPPPSISPLGQFRREEQIDRLLELLDSRPAAFCVRVFARKFADYRADSIYYGTFTSPFQADALQSQIQYEILVDKAMYLIQHTRPFSTMSSYVLRATKPEISYTTYPSQDVFIYPHDYTRRHNIDIRDPMVYEGLAYITVSVLPHAQLIGHGSHLRRRQPDSDDYSSGSEHPVFKKPRRLQHKSTQTPSYEEIPTH